MKLYVADLYDNFVGLFSFVVLDQVILRTTLHKDLSMFLCAMLTSPLCTCTASSTLWAQMKERKGKLECNLNSGFQKWMSHASDSCCCPYPSNSIWLPTNE